MGTRLVVAGNGTFMDLAPLAASGLPFDGPPIYAEKVPAFSGDSRTRIRKNIKSFVIAAILVGTLRGQTYDPAILRIAALSGNSQVKALRSALIGPIRNTGFYDTLFYCEARLRDSLRRLVSDRKAGVQAAYLLSLIADSEDLRAIIRKPPQTRFPRKGWAYGVASSLLDASKEEDWRFLWDCLTGKYHDPWASTGAIQTLKLIGTARSIALLEEAQRAKLPQGERIARAIASAKAQRPLQSGSSPEELSGSLALAFGARKTGAPRYNAAGDKALVNLERAAGPDLYIYTATLWIADGKWRLRGLQEVAQLYLSPAMMHAPQRGGSVVEMGLSQGEDSEQEGMTALFR